MKTKTAKAKMIENQQFLDELLSAYECTSCERAPTFIVEVSDDTGEFIAVISCCGCDGCDIDPIEIGTVSIDSEFLNLSS